MKTFVEFCENMAHQTALEKVGQLGQFGAQLSRSALNQQGFNQQEVDSLLKMGILQKDGLDYRMSDQGRFSNIYQQMTGAAPMFRQPKMPPMMPTAPRAPQVAPQRTS